MAWRKLYAQCIVTLLLLAGLLSCGGGGGSSAPPPPPSGTPFWAADFNTSTFYKVYSSVVATGTHCYIYVENGLTVSPTEANAIKNEFDTNIYPTITGKFGTEPNLDGDPNIYILLLNIRDGFDPHSSPSYVGGYFMSGNEYSVSDNSYSNEKEMFYMNFNPALKPYIWPAGFYTTLAHEFQHMIHWEQKTHLKGLDDDTWLNEAMSEVAPTYLYGPSYDRIYDYEQAPSDSLTIWKDSIDDYGIAYMWSQYFKDQFDPGSTGAIFSGIMQQNATGITSVDYALNTLASGNTFASTFKDMAIAIVSGKTINWTSHPEWSYTSIDTKEGTYDGVPLPGLVLTTTSNNKNLTTLPVLDPWSVGYSWYQPMSGVTGTVTWTRTSPAGATADFINYGNGSPPISLATDITSGMSYTYNTTGILIVSTPSPTAGGSVVNTSLSAGISTVSMTPKQMLSNANTYATKHKKNQKICVQSFFAEKEKELRSKGMHPKF